MAIRTASTTARSSSHSTQSAPKKPSSAQRSGSASRSSASTQSKQTSSASRRDTFTCSASAAKQAPSKTSAAKSNTTAKASSSKTAAKTKSAQTASKTKRDSFEFSSEAVKKSVQSAKSSKSSANSKAATKSSTKKSANAQTKKTAKSNSSNKNTASGSASKNNKSSKNNVPNGLKLHLKHTKDQKQKSGMQKTVKDIENSSSSEKNKKTKDRQNNKFDNNSITNGKILINDSRIQVGIYEGIEYTIVDDKTPSRSDVSTLNQDEKNYLVYLALHEAGGIGGFPSSLENPEAQMTAIVSAFMNAYEVSYYNNGDIDNIDGSKTNSLRTFNDAMATHCTQFASDDYTRNTLTNNLRNGDYSGLNFSDYTDEQIDCAETAVNTVLSGTRNINATAWYGTNSDRNTFQQNTWFSAKVKKK